MRSAGWGIGVIFFLIMGTQMLSGCPRQQRGDEIPSLPPLPPPPPPKIALRFADAALEAIVREKAGKPEGDLYKEDVAGLTELNARRRNLTDLAGIEALINLQSADLGANYLRDISPLASLVNLVELKLDDNFIADISPLASLVNLTWLDLSRNEISDLSPLASLSQLTILELEDNQISDLSPLAGLIHLTGLNLKRNPLQNFTPLCQNAEAGGLGPGDTIILSSSLLSLSRRNEALRCLKDKGVTLTK